MKFYGSSKSRAARCLWALEEVGAKYEHDPMPNTQAKNPDHLKRNPNGHIPVLEDEGHYIWESMAINLYLAEKYGKNGLWPADVFGHAAAYQWSIWAMTECEPHLLTMLMHKVLLPADQRDEKAGQKAADCDQGAAEGPRRRAQGQGVSARQYLHHRGPQCGLGVVMGGDDAPGLVGDADRCGMAAEVPRARGERESARDEVTTR